MLEIIDVDIDKNVVIPCPYIGFKPRRAANACPKYDNFNGIGIMSKDESLPWDKRFAVRCSHIVERRTQIIEVIEE